jgi:WD40 repeat protein
MRYDAFISYSHAADGQLAPALQRALQRMAKPWYRRRALEVFRDETGLAVDPHLWGAIVRALDDSEWFLLLTSPQAAASVWVGREIEHWKANRPLDRILPVLTDGHWMWDPDKGDFTDDSDAVPQALRGVFADEPRHLDLRWAHQDQQLTLRNGRFRDAVAEIAAPLHGRTKDDIEGEDVRQHRRTVRIAWSATAALAVLTVAAVTGAGIAVHNANKAEQRRIQAEGQRLAAESRTELERPDLAFLLAAHGYKLHDSVQTEAALLTAVATLPEFKQRIPTDAAVTALSFSDASDRVWVATADGNVTAYRYSDGAEIASTEGLFKQKVIAMAPASGVRDAVVVTDGITIVTLDAALKKSLVRVSPKALLSLAVEPTSERVAVGTVDGSVIVWDVDRRDPTLMFRAIPAATDGDYPWVNALAWTNDGRLVVGGQDGAIRMFDLNRTDGAVWEQPQVTKKGEAVFALAVAPDGTVVSGGSDGTVGFWNGADGAMTEAGINGLHSDEVHSLVATGAPPQDGSVASVGEDGFLIYWNHLTGLPALDPLRVDERGATAVSWDPSNSLRGVTGGKANGVLLLDYSDEERRPAARPAQGWTDAGAVAISPATDRLAVATISPEKSVDGEPRLVSELTLTDPSHPEPTGPSVRIDGGVDRIVFTRDGTRVLAATTDGTVAVWDGASDKATVTQVGPDGIPPELAIAPDGVTVATRPAGETTAQLWRLTHDELVKGNSIKGPRFGYGLAFSPDGESLVIGGADQFVIHRLDDGGRKTVDLGDEDTRSLAVSPDGSTIAVGVWSGPVLLIDAATGQPTGDDLRVGKRVTDLAFRGDGDQLITVSEDGTIIYWDLASRTRLSDKPVNAVSSDGGGAYARAPSLAVGSDIAVTASVADGKVVTWPLTPEEWIAEGCAVHRRNLTDAEKRRYGLEGASPICGS